MPLLHIAYAVIATLLWGGNYAAVKIGLPTFPPMLYNSFRFALVAAMLLPFVPRPSRRQLRRIAWIALMLCAGHMGLLFTGLYMGLNIAGSAIVLQLGVAFSCLLGAIIFNDRIGLWRMAGLILSGVGTILILGDPNILQNPLGCLATIGSALCWSVANILIKKLRGVSVMALLAWESLFAVPMTLALSLLFEHVRWRHVLHPPVEALLMVLYTAVFSTICAYGLWSWLMRTHDVSRVAPFALLVPFFATAGGMLVFHEHLSIELIQGGLLMVAGVGIITIRRPKLQALAERT